MRLAININVRENRETEEAERTELARMVSDVVTELRDGESTGGRVTDTSGHVVLDWEYQRS